MMVCVVENRSRMEDIHLLIQRLGGSMIVVASSNGKIGINAASEILRSGGTALDAVEAATRLVEANPEDHSVGYSGFPNLLGEVELDASIMDGQTLCLPERLVPSSVISIRFRSHVKSWKNCHMFCWSAMARHVSPANSA